MVGNNGKPLPFPTANVPIIGQPFTLKGGFSTTLVQCECEAKVPVLVIGAGPGVCAACRRTFVVLKFAFDGQTGQIQANVALAQPSPAAETPAEQVPS